MSSDGFISDDEKLLKYMRNRLDGHDYSILRSFVAMKCQEREELHEQIARDELTDLESNNAFQRRLEELQEHVTAHNLFGNFYLLLDLDDFKGVNDALGHPAGDEALKTTANLLRGALMTTDAKGRKYRGDEFQCVLYDVGPSISAIKRDAPDADSAPLLVKQETNVMNILGRLVTGFPAMMEPALETLASNAGWSEARIAAELPHVTMSIGATRFSPGESVDAVVARADDLLYQAKGAGKNQYLLG